MVKRSEVPIGTRFGRLVVLDELEDYVSPAGHRGRRFKLQCDCGNTTIAVLGNLRREGHTTSCGCAHKEATAKMGRSVATHGLSRHPLYSTHGQMVDRCTNPDHVAYDNYGGRGIGICDEWRYDLKAYMNWAISNGWKPGLSVDRIDNNGDYTPENCRIANATIQSRNRRFNVVTQEQANAIREDTRKPRFIMKEYGISRNVVYSIRTGKTWFDNTTHLTEDD